MPFSCIAVVIKCAYINKNATRNMRFLWKIWLCCKSKIFKLPLPALCLDIWPLLHQVFELVAVTSGVLHNDLVAERLDAFRHQMCPYVHGDGQGDSNNPVSSPWSCHRMQIVTKPCLKTRGEITYRDTLKWGIYPKKLENVDGKRQHKQHLGRCRKPFCRRPSCTLGAEEGRTGFVF